MKALILVVLLALNSQLAGCSRRSATYTENEVREFLVPGTPREAVVKRFPGATIIRKSPKIEDGSPEVDEILVFPVVVRGNDGRIFSDLELYLKDGRVVRWLATHGDAQIGP